MRILLRWLLVCAGVLFATPAFAACSVTTPLSAAIGSDSSNALKAGVAPYTSTFGGFTCTSSSILTLLSGNYLKATIAAGAPLTLTSTTTTDTVTYKLAASSDGSNQIVPGTPTYYVNGAVLSLLSNGTTSVPIYVKPLNTTATASGTYTGSVTIKWDWYFCSALSAANICIGTVDQGSKSSTITFTLIVAPQPTTMAVTSATTWDGISGTTDPKAIPGSRRRASITIANPDIVGLDTNTLALVMPVAAGTIVALDGDGSGSGSVVQTTDGSPASGLTVSYVSPSSTTDNVDFSSDGGVSWTYVPTAGDTTSEAAVTHIRIRPQGGMAAKSSFSVSIPFLVR